MRCKPAALLKRALGSEEAVPPIAPVPASSHPAGTERENPSNVSVYTLAAEDAEVACSTPAAKEGRVRRVAVAAARLLRAILREDDNEGSLETARPADRNNMSDFRCSKEMIAVS